MAVPPRHGVIGHARDWRPTSDAPCRAPQPFEVNPGRLRGAKIASAAPSSMRTTFPTRSAFPRQVLPKNAPLTRCVRFVGTRHRSRGFATDDPASGALSPLRRSRAEGLDPSSWSEDSSSSGVKGHALLVDFCNRYDPRARPRTTRTPHDLASGRPPAQPVSGPRPFGHDPELRMATLLSERGQPRCFGPGASTRSACLDSAPLAAIARNESFAPTQSARTPPVAARDERRLESPASLEELFRDPRARARQTAAAFAVVVSRGFRFRGARRKGRFTRSPAKGTTFRRTRGAFHRRIAPAGARFAVPKLSPACGLAKQAPLRSAFCPGL